jgi:hypothetical protein
MLVVGGSAACSLLVDLDGLTGDAGAIDAATTPDAVAADGTVVDGPVTIVDSAVDAGPDAFDAGPFCLRAKHDFCSDFDQAPTVGAGWESVYPYPGDAGNAALDLTTFTSPPASALVRCFAQPLPRGFILETNQFRKAATAAHYSIDARVETDTSAGTILLLALSFTTSGLAEYEVSLVVRGDKLDLEQHPNVDGGAYDSTRLSVGIKLATWTHIEGDLVFTAPAHAILRVDGVGALNVPLLAYGHPGAVNVQAGTVYTNLTTETRMHLDNVALDVE